MTAVSDKVRPDERYVFWKPRGSDFSKEEALQHMAKNVIKEWERFSKPWVVHSEFSPYPSRESLELLLQKEGTPSLIETAASEAQSLRPYMEDTHFIQILDGGDLLTGVFDGHGGKEVADYVRDQFQLLFSAALKEEPSVYHAFERCAYEINQYVLTANFWKDQGSTAVLAFVSESEQAIYTATIGDSEAYLYIKESDEYKILPLSGLRNWASHWDEARAIRAQGDSVRDSWKDLTAGRYFPTGFCFRSVNTSRSFGDRDVQVKGIGTIAKPKIMRVPKPTTSWRLILGSDGVWPWTVQHDMVGYFAEYDRTAQQISKDVKETVLRRHKKGFIGDNITVVVVKLEPQEIAL